MPHGPTDRPCLGFADAARVPSSWLFNTFTFLSRPDWPSLLPLRRHAPSVPCVGPHGPAVFPSLTKLDKPPSFSPLRASALLSLRGRSRRGSRGSSSATSSPSAGCCAASSSPTPAATPASPASSTPPPPSPPPPPSAPPRARGPCRRG